MIVGGPVGGIVGDPTEQGSLTRTVEFVTNKSTYTFSPVSGMFEFLDYILKDGVDSYFTSSPIEVTNVEQRPAARYLFSTPIADILRDQSGGLQLNRITTEILVKAVAVRGARFAEPFVRLAVGNIRKLDSRFNVGKFLNGKE